MFVCQQRFDAKLEKNGLISARATMTSKRRKSYNTPVFSPVKYVVVPPQKAHNNHVSIYCLKKLEFDNSLGKPTYTRRHLRQKTSEILTNVFGIANKDEELDLSWLKWIPNQQHYISGSATFCMNYYLTLLL